MKARKKKMTTGVTKEQLIEAAKLLGYNCHSSECTSEDCPFCVLTQRCMLKDDVYNWIYTLDKN